MTDRDAPLRLPLAPAAAIALDRRAVRRQLGLSLWLVTLVGVAFGTLMLARPTVAAPVPPAVEQGPAS